MKLQTKMFWALLYILFMTISKISMNLFLIALFSMILSFILFSKLCNILFLIFVSMWPKMLHHMNKKMSTNREKLNMRHVLTLIFDFGSSWKFLKMSSVNPPKYSNFITLKFIQKWWTKNFMTLKRYYT